MDKIEELKAEERIQQDVFVHAKNNYCLPAHDDRGIIFHVPNQRISKSERIKLSAIGVLPGVSDLIFIYKSKHLYLEVKTATGTQSDKQKEFQARIEANGSHYYIIRSVEDFKEVMLIEFGIEIK